MKKTLLFILTLLLFSGALASEWIPEGAVYEEALDCYILPDSGERLSLSLHPATGRPLTLIGASDYVPAEAGVPESVSGIYPGAWVISAHEETVNGGPALRILLVHEDFSGYILMGDGMIIGRELNFAPCIEDGMLTMTGAVSVLNLLRPGLIISEIELDEDDGLLLYEGEAFLSGEEYEFELDAHTARLLQWSR